MFFKKKEIKKERIVVKGKYQIIVAFGSPHDGSSGASKFMTKAQAEAKLKDLMLWMGKTKVISFIAIDDPFGKTIMNMAQCWKIEVGPSEDSDREPTFEDIEFQS